jgi:hypothetical protein
VIFQIIAFNMTAIIHPTANKDKDFVTAVHSAMMAIDSAGLKQDGRDCIGVFKGVNSRTDKEVAGWAVMETKDTEVGGFKVINGHNIRILAIITAKW